MRRFALLLLLPFLALAGCSSSAPTGVMPKVSGAFDYAPKITMPAGTPPTTLQDRVLHRGTGRVVQTGDLLVVDYVGQIWHGKVFDSSYGHEPFSTPIGVGQVIPAWDKDLVGQRVGSRVLLVVPPVDGYGKKGLSAAKITGTDTLVFVVDILGSYPKTAGGDPKATVLKHSVGGVSISGPTDGPPTVTVSPDAPLPTKRTVTLIARGRGPAVTAGLVVLQFVDKAWNNKLTQSTWTLIPFAATVGNPASPSTLDSLVGIPVGSRVLFDFPKTAKTAAQAVVIDVIAQPSAAPSS